MKKNTFIFALGLVLLIASLTSRSFAAEVSSKEGSLCALNQPDAALIQTTTATTLTHDPAGNAVR